MFNFISQRTFVKSKLPLESPHMVGRAKLPAILVRQKSRSNSLPTNPTLADICTNSRHAFGATALLTISHFVIKHDLRSHIKYSTG